jgi:hypothetical protein
MAAVSPEITPADDCPLLHYSHMTTREKVESLIEQVVELPEDAQVELVDSLLELRAERLGIYHLDDDEREALARSAEDVRLGRFASDAEVEQTFARYRGA